MTNPLRLVDDNGELVTPGCDGCRDKSAKIAGLEGDLDALTRELATVIRQRDALKRDREKERETHPKRAEITACFEHWVERQRQARPKRRKFILSADRFDAVKARLNEGYTVEEIQLAIDGAVAFPFVVNGQRSANGRGERHDDLELVCRGGKRLEKLANLGAVWRRQETA